MATSNQKLFDAFIRHQIDIQRLTLGEVNGILKMLGTADKELNALIESRLSDILAPDFTTKRWKAMVGEIQKTRSSLINSVGSSLDSTMGSVVKTELGMTNAIFSQAVPVVFNFAAPNIAAVQALTKAQPFGSANAVQTLGEWMDNLVVADQNRIIGGVKAGIMNGETIPQIQNRVMKAAQMTQQNAEAITRTMVNHASNTARDAFHQDNSDVINALRWTATLDGRVSAICRARDGHFDALNGDDMKGVPVPHLVGSPRRPPAHLRCRSLMIAMLDGQALADQLPTRPTVTDTRTGQRRRLDFEKDARRAAKANGEKWKDLSGAEKAPYRKAVRAEWAKKNVGSVPGKTTYDEWMRKQDHAFQNKVLGKAKAKAFREGLKLDQFVDRAGNELTLKQLENKVPRKNPVRRNDKATKAAAKARQAEIAKASTARDARGRAALEKQNAKEIRRLDRAEDRRKRLEAAKKNRDK